MRKQQKNGVVDTIKVQEFVQRRTERAAAIRNIRRIEYNEASSVIEDYGKKVRQGHVEKVYSIARDTIRLKIAENLPKKDYWYTKPTRKNLETVKRQLNALYERKKTEYQNTDMRCGTDDMMWNQLKSIKDDYTLFRNLYLRVLIGTEKAVQ